MHQHLVAAAVWRWRNGKPAEKLLRKVAEGELVLVSTGAADWLGSNGTLRPVEGGYRLDARKVFSSGSPAGDLLITSARLEGPGDAEVLHFPVPLSAPGVEVLDNWRTLGMRGTGSNDVVLKDVFVPDEAIALRRPADVFHPSWAVVLTVALPLIVAAYLGVAERAAELAIERARRRSGEETWSLLGEMKNQLATAQYALKALVENAADLDFAAELERADAALVGKTVASQAAIACVAKALEVSGSGAFFRRDELELLFRDVQASRFHPLAEKTQTRFSGRVAMGLDPV
jgi:alkylation response protein AidB-like acyl-CoA dehydrogenase